MRYDFINRWIEAENEIRKGNYEKALELKDKWKSRFDKLPKEKQEKIMRDLLNLGG